MIFFSPNGGHCCALAREAGGLLVGGLMNASAVAAAAVKLHRQLGRPVTVVACGERWPGSETLRPCLEDYLGAGAIISAMRLEMSAEALCAARAFDAARAAVADLLWDCGSGRELRARGFSVDLRVMTDVDSTPVAPQRGADGWIRPGV